MTSLRTFKKQLFKVKWVRDSRRRSVQRKKFQRADIVVISFPKAGRTWLRVLLGRILSEKYHKKFTIELEELADGRVPCIYMTHEGVSEANKALSVNNRKYRNKKVISLVRDPRDVVVSYYFQCTKRMKSPVALDLQSFIRDQRYGIDQIIAHMNMCAQNRHVSKDFLLVKYEDLRRDTVKELRRLMEFLGIKDLDDEELQQAIDFASFDNMLRMEKSNALQNGRLKTKNPNDREAYKVRRGKVGGYVDYLSEEDIEYLNSRVKDGLVKEYGYL
jgi:hypothetical protein